MDPVIDQAFDAGSAGKRIVLVTGTLAEPSVRQMARQLTARFAIEADVIVLDIQVAALMTPQWVAAKLCLPDDAPTPDRVILPGYCRGDLAPIEAKLGASVERGPRDLQDLPIMFDPSRKPSASFDTYEQYNIEIIAEINDAAHLPTDLVMDQADALARDGADIIDLGCDPQVDRPAWEGLADLVRRLRDRGLRVSVDSFQPREAAAACAAGAELVLSVNSANCQAAADWDAQVVAIPDDPHDLAGLDQTIAHLEKQDVPYRIDPVIEPIGFGFAQSLGRYLEARRRYPDTAMMMGIGNLTEMTGADSAGVNMLLLGFCQELNITSVLTTQVINWARSAVAEIDLARRMMHYAVTQRTVPKHLDERLVMLRDPHLRQVDELALAELATKLKDDNIRLFADPQQQKIHAMNRRVHAIGDDPFIVFDQLGIDDPSHAFYLGYEMAKAVTAMTLGKNYTQDQTLNWGMLTQPEASHYDRRRRQSGA